MKTGSEKGCCKENGNCCHGEKKDKKICRRKKNVSHCCGKKERCEEREPNND